MKLIPELLEQLAEEQDKNDELKLKIDKLQREYIDKEQQCSTCEYLKEKDQDYSESIEYYQEKLSYAKIDNKSLRDRIIKVEKELNKLKLDNDYKRKKMNDS